MSSQTRLLQVQRWQRQLCCNEFPESFLEVAALKERQNVVKACLEEPFDWGERFCRTLNTCKDD